ncbi:MAG TPA: TetR/AcrR family transcriptional regulator [Candidatus Limnocylindrales bacterium]|jgi:AcrR family transcriptional regulator
MPSDSTARARQTDPSPHGRRARLHGLDAQPAAERVALRAATELEHRRVGRPRSGTADRAILDAAFALLIENGVSGLTMSAVVSRSRVARATVYRRYPTREALIAGTLAQIKGREPYPLTGDVEADIATGVRAAAGVLQEAQFRRFLPYFVTEALEGPAVARAQIDRVAPNHGKVAREYAEHAAMSGLRTDIDPTIVSDLVQGSMLMRFLSSGTPPDANAVRQVTDVLLRGLRARPEDETPAD